jgi:hypothetical protein
MLCGDTMQRSLKMTMGLEEMCLTCEQMFTYTTLYIVSTIVLYNSGVYWEQEAYAKRQ